MSDPIKDLLALATEWERHPHDIARALSTVFIEHVAWWRSRRSGSIEAVFNDGTPKHVHRRDTLYLQRRQGGPE